MGRVTECVTGIHGFLCLLPVRVLAGSEGGDNHYHLVLLDRVEQPVVPDAISVELTELALNTGTW